MDSKGLLGWNSLGLYFNPKKTHCHQKRGVWLLPAQIPLKSQSGWKGKFALFWMPAKWRGEEGSCRKAEPLFNHWTKSFYRWRGEATCTVTWLSSWNWSCTGLISIILIIINTVNLQFQSWFVPISLRPVLRIVEADVMATVWSSYS